MFFEIAKKNNKLNSEGTDYECPLTLPHLVIKHYNFTNYLRCILKEVF